MNWSVTKVATRDKNIVYELEFDARLRMWIVRCRYKGGLVWDNQYKDKNSAMITFRQWKR